MFDLIKLDFNGTIQLDVTWFAFLVFYKPLRVVVSVLQFIRTLEVFKGIAVNSICMKTYKFRVSIFIVAWIWS